MRSLFVTVSLAHGQSDHWVMDRTLHMTRGQLNIYNRKLAHFRKHGPIVSAVVTVPELAAFADSIAPAIAPKAPSDGTDGEGREDPRPRENKRVAPPGVEPCS